MHPYCKVACDLLLLVSSRLVSLRLFRMLACNHQSLRISTSLSLCIIVGSTFRRSCFLRQSSDSNTAGATPATTGSGVFDLKQTSQMPRFGLASSMLLEISDIWTTVMLWNYPNTPFNGALSGKHPSGRYKVSISQDLQKPTTFFYFFPILISLIVSNLLRCHALHFTCNDSGSCQNSSKCDCSTFSRSS